MGLTSLFGMGRGEHHRYNHQKIINVRNYVKKIFITILNEAYGLLVLLSFDITAFTPVAYQRHSL